MKRAASSDIESHILKHEHSTSIKVKLQGAGEYTEYLTRKNLIHIKQRAFDFFTYDYIDKHVDSMSNRKREESDSDDRMIGF